LQEKTRIAATLQDDLIILLFISEVAFYKALAFMGLLDCMTVSGGVSGDVFYEFVHTRFFPHLSSFNGYNIHSIVIMDNAYLNSVDGFVDMIQQVGVYATVLT